MDIEGRPSSGRESGQGNKSEGYSEYGETSGIVSGTQSPTIIVPTADDGVLADDSKDTQGCGAGDGDDDMQTSDEGFGQEEAESDEGQGLSRPQREVKFSDLEQTSAERAHSEIPDVESFDEAEALRPGQNTPEESQEVAETQGQPFTLFAILPTKEVVTLRDVSSGSTVYHVQYLIELSGGIPSECYSLVSSTSAEKLSADTKLVLGENITAGATMRIIPHLAWLEVFRAIWHSDVDFISKTGEACLMGNMSPQEAVEKENTYRKRMLFCLFMACARGEKEMCQIFIEMGADVTGRTNYGNTALHAAARHNQLVVVDLLLKNGATSSQNVFGKTVTEIAKEAGAFSCERYLRLHKWSLTGQNYAISPKPSPRVSKPASATSQRSSQSGRFLKSQVFLPKGADNMMNDQTGGFFSNKALMSSSNLPNIDKRCKSAPVGRSAQKSRPSTAQSATRGGSKYHKDCLQRGGVITVSKPQKDYLGADIVKYIDHPMVTGTVENVHVYVPSVATDINVGTNACDGVSGGRVPRDFEKDNANDPDRTVLAETLCRWENDQNNRQLQKKPRAKSASARLYKSHFHKYLEPEEPVYYSRVKELRERRAQTAVLSPEEEERRLRNDAAYQRWMAKKTAQGAFSPQEKDGQLVLPSGKHTREENERAFERWLEEKEDEEPQKMNCLERRIDRENVVQFGCTDPEDVVLSSPEDNHLSYQRWLGSQQEKGSSRGSYTSDEPSDVLRRRTEEKRRKTIINVKAYEEWLEEIEEEEEVERKIAMEKKQAAQQANEETKKQRAPKQVSFSRWLAMKERKRQEEKKRQRMEDAQKAEEERLRNEDWSTGTNVKTFKQWYILQGKPKPVKDPKKGREGQTRAEQLQREKEERAKMARESFDSWAIQKALQDLQLEKQRLRQEERRLDMMRGRKQTTIQ
ncbi:uncharacterized protein LOC135495645 [Lineus longissimus]|uniref:uncharacterized protein LOC135495645 n=1 Tax=Lineus longissimus TaxID=88925 RepID=UPI00315D1A45